jgi:tetratricopeptide (TPR) repeat protein
LATYDEAIARARQHLGAGDLNSAEVIYRRVLEAVPKAAEGWHELGVVLLQTDRSDEAVHCLRQAVALAPATPIFHVNLAAAYRMLRCPEEAIASYRQTLQLGPPTPELLNNFALALKDVGQSEAALGAFDQALSLRPEYANGHFNRGNLLLDLHRLDAAAASYRRAIELAPSDAFAHCKLGMVYFEQSAPESTDSTETRAFHAERLVDAVVCFERAVDLQPDYVEAVTNLGVAHERVGHWAAAERCWRRALELNPAQAAAHASLATILERQDRLEEAVAECRRALELQPDFAEALSNLGTLLSKQSQGEAAAECWRRAIESQPEFVAAHINLGGWLSQQGRWDEAAACYRRAIDLQPESADAHGHLAGVLAGQDRPIEALAEYRRAIELRPDFPEMYNNLAGVLESVGKFDEAIECCRRAVEMKPDLAAARGNLGMLLSGQGRVDEARACYAEAIAIEPLEPVWKLNRLTLCPTVFASNREIDDYRQGLLEELAHFDTATLDRDFPNRATSGCMPAFNWQFHGRNDRPLREAYARLFRGCFDDETAPGSSGRPRVGMVVTHAHEGAFARSLGAVIERMDPERFEIVIIGPERGVSTLRSAIRGQHVRIVGVANQLERFVAAIRAEQLDVVYYWEVGTDPVNYFLPFHRLAPVQCTSWGIQVTSGIPHLDYYLSSGLVERDDAQQHYTEKLVLADTLLTFQRRSARQGPVMPRETFGIHPDRHVYLCAQQLGKFQPDFDPILAGILRRDEQGLVVVTGDRQGGPIAKLLRQRFESTMPDVVERIVFLPMQPTREYLNLVADADVLLDPLHFGGVNSSYDGFSLNQPIVTLPSPYQRGRYTLGCYQKMGVLDCVATDAEHYVEIAVALGTDSSRRAEVVEKIRGASDALFEDRSAVTEHERLFGELIDQARARRNS